MGTRRVLLVTGALVVAVAGCGVAVPFSGSTGQSTVLTGGVAGSRKTYVDLESVARDSDTVVLGTLGAISATREDNGGNAGAPGIPMAFHQVRVTESIRSSAPVAADIGVTWLDLTKTRAEDLRPLPGPGTVLVLFLTRLDKARAPGVADLAPVYVPTSGDVGVFEVQGPTAVARAAELTRVLPAEAPAAGRLAVPLSRLRLVAAASRP